MKREILVLLLLLPAYFLQAELVPEDIVVLELF
jgi:hypothetical protein